MSITNTIFTMALGFVIVGAVRYWRTAQLLNRAIAHIDALEAELAKRQASSTIAAAHKPQASSIEHQTIEPASTYVDYTALDGAGTALAKPPSDLRTTLAHLKTNAAGQSFAFPLGWATEGLYTASFVNDVNHVLISGMSNAGKDNAVTGMLLSLALQYGPERLQIAILDGKGLDWLQWANKAHTWLLADEPEKIGEAMAKLTDERRRRRSILAAAGCAAWDEYQGGDLPLLVVFISELSLLEDATKASQLTAWLNSELSAGRAFGIRFIIGTQNASNFDTRWRGQISLFMAGFQPSRAADEPNTGLSTTDLESIGAIPPSKLLAPPEGSGVFTVVHAPKGGTVRVPLLASQHRRWLLDQLPNALQNRASGQPTSQPANQPTTVDSSAYLAQLLANESSQPLPTALAHSEGQISAFENGSGSGNLALANAAPEAPEALLGIEPSEVERIVATAQTARSRRQLCQALYNTVGGNPYSKVAQVCDHFGLLMPQAKAA